MKSWARTILTLGPNPPERMFEMYIIKSSQEDFALKSKLWPPSFSLHRPIFAGNSRSTRISQLRVGKTRSKLELKSRIFESLFKAIQGKAI